MEEVILIGIMIVNAVVFTWVLLIAINIIKDNDVR
jgi:hypothetical protein